MQILKQKNYDITKSSKCANKRLEDFFFLVLFFFVAKLFSSRNKIKNQIKNLISLLVRCPYLLRKDKLSNLPWRKIIISLGTDFV